jgi:hypothetical protein
MRVTVSFSDQQLAVLVATLAERRPELERLDQLVAAAFDEYCRDHPEQAGGRPDDG